MSQESFFEIEIASCLALHWSSLLMLLCLFMVCGISHFGYNGATICLRFHRQHSPPTRKSSAIHSRTHDIRALPLPRRFVPFLSQRRRPVCKHWLCLVLATRYTALFTDFRGWANNYSQSGRFQILPTSRRERRSSIVFIRKIFQKCCQKNRIANIFLQRKTFKFEKPKRPNEIFKARSQKHAK